MMSASQRHRAPSARTDPSHHDCARSARTRCARSARTRCARSARTRCRRRHRMDELSGRQRLPGPPSGWPGNPRPGSAVGPRTARRQSRGPCSQPFPAGCHGEAPAGVSASRTPRGPAIDGVPEGAARHSADWRSSVSRGARATAGARGDRGAASACSRRRAPARPRASTRSPRQPPARVAARPASSGARRHRRRAARPHRSPLPCCRIDGGRA